MALETAGGIASIAAIIIDVASICLRLRDRIQEIPQALDALNVDIGHLEKVLSLFENAESEQQLSEPRNIPDDAQTIVDDCKDLCRMFADMVRTWRHDRYIFGYNWIPVYLVFFQHRKMRHASKCVRNCLSKVSAVASIATRHDLIREAAVTREKMAMMSANHAETVNSLQSLEEDMGGLTKTLEDMKAKMEEGNENHRLKICQQQEQENEALEELTEIVKNDCQTFRISAAKDAEQHMATDKETTELQTGCSKCRSVEQSKGYFMVRSQPKIKLPRGSEKGPSP